MRPILKFLEPSNVLPIAALATLLLVTSNAHAEKLVKINRVTYAKVHFHGIPNLSDDERMTFEFSDKRPGPKTASFQFWGIAITQPEKLRQFLEKRVLSCWQIYEINEVGYVDCTASPARGVEQLLTVSSPNWLDLFTWLPELGLARNHCNLPANLQVRTSDPEVAYFCQTSNGHSSDRSKPHAIPIRTMPLVPSTY